MLYTYSQTFSAEKNHVGGGFHLPKSTAKSPRGSSEHIKTIYGIGSTVKSCQENFPGVVKNCAKQNNINQTFDHFLLRVKNSDQEMSKKVECWIMNNIYLVHQAVHALEKVFSSDKEPKLYKVPKIFVSVNLFCRKLGPE